MVYTPSLSIPNVPKPLPSYIIDVGDPGAPAGPRLPMPTSPDTPPVVAAPAQPDPASRGTVLTHDDTVHFFARSTDVARVGRVNADGFRIVQVVGLGGPDAMKHMLRFSNVEEARAGVDALDNGPRTQDVVWALLKGPKDGVVAAQLLVGARAVNDTGKASQDASVEIPSHRNWTSPGPARSDLFDFTQGKPLVQPMRDDLIEILTPHYTLQADDKGTMRPV